MGATKRDLSGVFDADLQSQAGRKSAMLDRVHQISPKGMTFLTKQFLPEWTEVGVEMRVPVGSTRKDEQIDCRGVVVQCVRREKGSGFEVALIFLDLPKSAVACLTNPTRPVESFGISLSH